MNLAMAMAMATGGVLVGGPLLGMMLYDRETKVEKQTDVYDYKIEMEVVPPSEDEDNTI
jgi:hypothetical protein